MTTAEHMGPVRVTESQRQQERDDYIKLANYALRVLKSEYDPADVINWIKTESMVLGLASMDSGSLETAQCKHDCSRS